MGAIRASNRPLTDLHHESSEAEQKGEEQLQARSFETKRFCTELRNIALHDFFSDHFALRGLSSVLAQYEQMYKVLYL